LCHHARPGPKSVASGEDAVVTLTARMQVGLCP
jgi:hypothetical protein